MNRNLFTALKFADLYVTLNHTEILRGVSGELRRGEVTGILGPNGCGKTTLLRALCRLIKADSGSITLCGGTAETDIAVLAPKRPSARRVSFLPQQRDRCRISPPKRSSPMGAIPTSAFRARCPIKTAPSFKTRLKLPVCRPLPTAACPCFRAASASACSSPCF